MQDIPDLPFYDYAHYWLVMLTVMARSYVAIWLA